MERALTWVRLYLPQARPFLPHTAALFFFGLLGWANGYFQSTTAVNNPNLKDSWSLPNWAPYHAGPERVLFSQLDIWDGKKPKSANKQDAAPPVQAWQLVGTVRTGKNYTALILLGDGLKIQRASSGDVLPNGEKILAVDNGLLRIDAAGQEREIKLFQSGKK